MLIVFYMLATFGLAFGVQNKAQLFHRFLPDGLVECPYCLGFWMGWVTWIVSWQIHGVPVTSVLAPLAEPVWLNRILGGLVWAFATATVSLLLNQCVPEST